MCVPGMSENRRENGEDRRNEAFEYPKAIPAMHRICFCLAAVPALLAGANCSSTGHRVTPTIVAPSYNPGAPTATALPTGGLWASAQPLTGVDLEGVVGLSIGTTLLPVPRFWVCGRDTVSGAGQIWGRNATAWSLE